MNLFPSSFEKESVAEKCCFKGPKAVGAPPPLQKGGNRRFSKIVFNLECRKVQVVQKSSNLAFIIKLHKKNL
jgi:hypothetical protein